MKNKILTILLSVAIAFGLWLYVITYEYTQIEYTFHNVEVQLLGISTLNDRGLMVGSGSEYAVDLKISGKRSDISRLRSSDITVTANLSSIYEAGQKNISYDVSFPGDLSNGGIEIVTRTPEAIQINIVKKIESDIPVVVELQGELPEGYVVGEYTLSHSSVHLSGPEEWLSKIKKGKVTVDMSDRTDTFEGTVKLQLCDVDGNKIDGDMQSVTVSNSMIQVKVPVLMRKEIQLLLPIIPGGGLTAEDVDLNMSAKSITVVGSPSVIAGLPDSVELGKVDLGEETGSFISREYLIPLNGNFTVEGNQGLKVYVTLTVPEMVEKEYEISHDQIEIIGVPEGYTATPTRKVKVTVRYIKELENQIDFTALRAIVDVAGAKADDHYPVRVEVETGSGIGIIDSESTTYIMLEEDNG